MSEITAPIGATTKTAPTQPLSLRVNYALKVEGLGHTACDIAGAVYLAYALAPDGRRDAAANFKNVIELLVLRPALMQVTNFVNGLRLKDIQAREAAAQTAASGAGEAAKSEPAGDATETPSRADGVTPGSDVPSLSGTDTDETNRRCEIA